MFCSTLNPNEFVIDEQTCDTYAPTSKDLIVDGEPVLRGLMPRDFSVHPFEGFAGARKFDIPIMDEKQIREGAEMLERKRSRLSDLIVHSKTPCKNQARTNYCWINAPVRAVELTRIKQGNPYKELSPASAGARIKNFNNVGGWGTEGVVWLGQHGVTEARLWPANEISKRYLTEESKENAMLYRLDEWFDLKCGDRLTFFRLCTALLRGLPVPIGLNWWRHEVLALDVVILSNGALGIRCENSWGPSYGDKGRFILNQTKGTPDDAVAPCSAYSTAA